MNLNKNDYVVVNGKKYYADGGKTDDKKPKKQQSDQNVDEFTDNKPYHINDDYTLTINSNLPKNHQERLKKISSARSEIMNELIDDPKKFESKITPLIEGDSHSNLYWYKHPKYGNIAMRKSGNNYFFDVDSSDYGLEPYFQYYNGLPLYTTNDSGERYPVASNEDYQFLINNKVDEKGYVNLPPEHWLVKGEYANYGPIKIKDYMSARDKANARGAFAPKVSWFNLAHSKQDWKDAGFKWEDVPNADRLALVKYTNHDVRKNASKFISNLPEKTQKLLRHDFGGQTNRLYAVGGAMGDIPLGSQEDYNMVGAGGSHEENPQGGVPYGMNQDGSQNMVEEGEVSVGDKVFSDRTQLTPELCQQLGLPEGTSPAQAMQQIEALYEQGQIGDEEFQEIQEVIFQDQEMQKQGEEMQQEMPPNEGILPDMIQGANMPPNEGISPDMMQQQGAPMTPQNEGIQPEMVQGYAYGGRMW
ncbi:MAG: hypothetical protein II956_14025 [Bacteroidales bacterium]|nr:hypothetical protein [Bacteroidales bacterium]